MAEDHPYFCIVLHCMFDHILWYEARGPNFLVKLKYEFNMVTNCSMLIIKCVWIHLHTVEAKKSLGKAVVTQFDSLTLQTAH